MMDFNLEDLREAAVDSLDILFDDVFPDVLATGTDEEVLDVVREACTYLHTRGVATLLLDGNPQLFFHSLGCAAENWRRLLVHLRARGGALPHASENAALLGAVAAGYWELATSLCAVSPTEQAPEEYDDEFAWSQLLAALIVLPEGAPVSDLLLQRFERTLEDSQERRIAMFDALLARDEKRFRAAFSQVLQQHAQETEQEAGRAGVSPEQFAPYRFIWFEGLAILRLAARQGLKLDDPFQFCPPLARGPVTMAYDGDWALPF